MVRRRVHHQNLPAREGASAVRSGSTFLGTDIDTTGTKFASAADDDDLAVAPCPTKIRIQSEKHRLDLCCPRGVALDTVRSDVAPATADVGLEGAPVSALDFYSEARKPRTARLKVESS